MPGSQTLLPLLHALVGACVTVYVRCYFCVCGLSAPNFSLQNACSVKVWYIEQIALNETIAVDEYLIKSKAGRHGAK